MAETGTTRIDWSTAPMVLVQRPACPYCLHEKYTKSHTRRTDADDVMRFVRCDGCGEVYRIRMDSPNLGLDIQWPG